jgi:plastocyanin
MVAGLAAGLAAGANASSAQSGTIVGTVRVSGVAGAAGVVVYVERIPGMTFPSPTERAVIDQRGLTFIPHVLPVLVGTTVDFHNGEEPSGGRAIRHNVFSPSRTARFDLGTYGYGQSKSVTFGQPGIATVLCNVHPEMSAYVVVLETPFFAVTDSAGTYRLEGVPPGRRVVRAWHPGLQPASHEVELVDQAVVDFRLRR